MSMAGPGVGATVAADTAAPATTTGEWVRLLRPKQWAKNSFVLAPLLFSGLVSQPDKILRALAAFALFCMLASGVYCWNDVADRAADRNHPIKRNRPIARGTIAARPAILAGAALVAVAMTGSWLIAPGLGTVMLAYLVLNVIYTRVLKALVILDVFAIAAFFVLRLLAGAAAIDVRPSVWLLLCGGLLALYIGFAKRRHELAILGEESAGHRSVLEHYDVALLDQMSVILLSVTMVSYIMYTLTSATAVQAGRETLSYSAGFVLYGMFRYLYLVHGTGKGGDPTDTLLTDRAMLVNGMLWLAYCGWVIY